MQQEFYASYCQTPCNSNGADAFNISYELSTTIGLNASQYVLISLIDQVCPLERVFVTPVTNADWDLLVSNKQIIVCWLSNLWNNIYHYTTNIIKCLMINDISDDIPKE